MCYNGTMNIRQFLKENIVILDGAMGTLLQNEGLSPGEHPERWNISHPETVVDIHKRYFDVGSNIVCTNTFGANSLKFSKEELNSIIIHAVDNANTARYKSLGKQEKFVAFDLSTVGKLLKPYGSLGFEEAVALYGESIEIAAKLEVDLIYIETMNDSYDTKAALLAAKENSDLPVFVTNAYGEDGKLMTGAKPEAMVAMLEGMGAEAIGVNCSLGPRQLSDTVKDYLKYASVPVILKPNAGLPRVVNGETVFDVDADDFSDEVMSHVKNGVRLIGGCCGTDPTYISALRDKTKNIVPVPVQDKNITMVSSYTHGVVFDKAPILIGERINPTGKKKLKEALKAGDMDYVLNEALEQADRGAHILDINTGMPEIDEAKMLKEVCLGVQEVSDLPLQIDTGDPIAMEGALRVYNGKPMINSVSGKKKVMEEIFPLAKKYGGLIVCLTLDDDGIPDSAKKRLDIARKIVDTASSYGISKKDLIFDSLAMAVSADSNAAAATLEAVYSIRHELGCHTLLGVSNISFGLPARESITAGFYMLALSKGLSAAIMNPKSDEIMRMYYSYRALLGLDESCKEYVEKIFSLNQTASLEPVNQNSNELKIEGLKRAIVRGLRKESLEYTRELLKNGVESLSIVEQYVIPALDIVGIGFQNGSMFLPQLLMSAEASQSAFSVIKEDMKSRPGKNVSKGKCILATVRGDIHDIGKNIVKLIMENYGFEIIDLGKDVPEETIVEAAIRENVPIVGLSALMTTTLPAMEQTIKLLNKRAPDIKIVVGGAVLTSDYAYAIGADHYGKDAMSTVRFAMEVSNNENN